MYGHLMPDRKTRPLPHCRSWLFLGGDEPADLMTAADGGADVVILELEDFTPPAKRPAARAAAADLFAAWRAAGAVAAVRINPLAEDGRTDLNAVMGGRPDMVLLPKVQDRDSIRELAYVITLLEHQLGIAEGSTKIVPNCESAMAVLDTRVIAMAHPRVVGCLMASEDLATDLGAIRTRESGEIATLRALFHASCVAAGVLSIDCPSTFDEPSAVAAHTEAAKALGYHAKSCVAREHAAIINEILTPSATEIAKAQEVVALFTAAREAGHGRAERDGHLIELPTARNAEALLARAEAFGLL